MDLIDFLNNEDTESEMRGHEKCLRESTLKERMHGIVRFITNV